MCLGVREGGDISPVSCASSCVYVSVLLPLLLLFFPGIEAAVDVDPHPRRRGVRRAGGGVRDHADVSGQRLRRRGNDPRHRQQPGACMVTVRVCDSPVV